MGDIPVHMDDVNGIDLDPMNPLGSPVTSNGYSPPLETDPLDEEHKNPRYMWCCLFLTFVIALIGVGAAFYSADYFYNKSLPEGTAINNGVMKGTMAAWDVDSRTLTVSHFTTLQDTNVKGNLNARKNVTVDGGSLLNSDLTTLGPVYFDKTLIVNELTTLHDSLILSSTNSYLKIGETIILDAASGNASFVDGGSPNGGSITIAGHAFVHQTLHVDSEAMVYGFTNLFDGAHIEPSLTVTGVIDLNSGQFVADQTSKSVSISTESVTVTTDLESGGKSHFIGSFVISKTSGSHPLFTANVSDAATSVTIGGKLLVEQSVVFDGELTLHSDLTINSQSRDQSNLPSAFVVNAATGDLTSFGKIQINADSNEINGTLTVQGDTTFYGNVSISGGSDSGDFFRVEKKMNVNPTAVLEINRVSGAGVYNGDLTLRGVISNTGGLNVIGNSMITGNFDVSQILSVPTLNVNSVATLASTVFQGGSVSVASGNLVLANDGSINLRLASDSHLVAMYGQNNNILALKATTGGDLELGRTLTVHSHIAVPNPVTQGDVFSVDTATTTLKMTGTFELGDTYSIAALKTNFSNSKFGIDSFLIVNALQITSSVNSHFHISYPTSLSTPPYDDCLLIGHASFPDDAPISGSVWTRQSVPKQYIGSTVKIDAYVSSTDLQSADGTFGFVVGVQTDGLSRVGNEYGVCMNTNTASQPGFFAFLTFVTTSSGEIGFGHCVSGVFTRIGAPTTVTLTSGGGYRLIATFNGQQGTASVTFRAYVAGGNFNDPDSNTRNPPGQDEVADYSGPNWVSQYLGAVAYPYLDAYWGVGMAAVGNTELYLGYLDISVPVDKTGSLVYKSGTQVNDMIIKTVSVTFSSASPPPSPCAKLDLGSTPLYVATDSISITPSLNSGSTLPANNIPQATHSIVVNSGVSELWVCMSVFDTTTGTNQWSSLTFPLTFDYRVMIVRSQ